MIQASWQMNPDLVARFNRAIDAGLLAAANHYAQVLRDKFAKGYTTGAFVTGALAGAVEVSPPMIDGETHYVVVGVPDGFEYALYWEMGHLNVYTHRHERVEHWRLTLVEEWQAMGDAFFAAFTEVMDGAEHTPGAPRMEGTLFTDLPRPTVA